MTEYLDTHTAIVGASGAGKTVTAKGHVEALLDLRRHVCILDPTSAWWGLRSNVAGDVVIFAQGDWTQPMSRFNYPDLKPGPFYRFA